MLVSIITATFNSAATITDTLHSVQSQTHPAIEHLIIDGASSDNTLEIIQGTPGRYRIHSGKDKGIYDAMNKGITMANGEIIGILNSDDMYTHPSVIEKVVKLFQQEDCDAVYGDLIYVDATDTAVVKRKWVAGPYVPKSFLYGWMPPHPTFFC